MDAPQRVRVPFLERVALNMLAEQLQMSEDALLTKLIRDAVLHALTDADTGSATTVAPSAEGNHVTD